MKKTVTLKVQFEYDSKSLAESYGEEDTKEHREYAESQAQMCAEYSVHQMIQRMGFEGKVINPTFDE